MISEMQKSMERVLATLGEIAGVEPGDVEGLIEWAEDAKSFMAAPAPIAQAQGDEALIAWIEEASFPGRLGWPVVDVGRLRAYLASRPSAPVAQEDDQHEWNHGAGEGDTCVKCGDKDWMADPTCSGRAPAPQAGMGAGEVEALVAGLREKIAGKRTRGHLLRHTASHLQVKKGQELEQDADLLEQCADTIDALARQLSEAQVPPSYRAAAEVALAFAESCDVCEHPFTALAHIRGLAKLLLALPAQPQERGAPEVDCPKCKGSGEREYFYGGGPDQESAVGLCDGCNGDGTVSAPAAGESEGKP